MNLPNPFAKKEEITCKCKNSDTLILCSCHFEPMLFKREDAENAIKNQYNQCDVCRQIDVIWATEMRKQLDEYQISLESDLMFHLLKDGEKGIPDFPDLPVLVANAIKLTISDFNKNPDKHRSICERKLQLARGVPEP